MTKTDRRVLVTGGAGYIGSVVVRHLLSAGWCVTMLDRLVHGNTPRTEDGLDLCVCDIRNIEVLRRVVPGHHAVLHLAFLSNDPGYGVDPGLAWSVNVEALGPLLDLSRVAGVERFVFASSCSVYGAVAANMHEDSPLSPVSDYARAKVACEAILEKAARSLPTVIVRPATVCGCSPRQRLDLTVNRMTADAWFTGKIQVETPELIRPSIHIDDLARLYVMALENDTMLGSVVNAAFENQTILQIAHLVASRLKVPIHVTGERRKDTRSYSVSSERLISLGFMPRFGVVEAVDQLSDAFGNGSFPGAPDADQYHNAKTQSKHDFES